DATYCVEDIPCGDIGSACPQAGAIAWGDCRKHLASFQNDSCVAPWNSTCQVIRTAGGVDIRGCVWSRDSAKKHEHDEAESNVRSSAVAASSSVGGSAQDVSAPLVYGASGFALVLAVAAVAIATAKVPKAAAAVETAADQDKRQEANVEEDAENEAKHLNSLDGAVVEV
ncbi:hypothetical protein H310_14963, partial [Aphanomyces invadans]